MEKENKNNYSEYSKIWEEQKKADPDLFNKMCKPGIFQIECVITNRSYFADSLETWVDLANFIAMCRTGVCPIQQLQEDFTKYGLENFDCFIVVSGAEFFDDKKRLIALEEYKKSWPGELY